MEYALCIKSNPKEEIFRIKSRSLEDAKKKFIHMKQINEDQFDKIFIVAEIKHERR